MRSYLAAAFFAVAALANPVPWQTTTAPSSSPTGSTSGCKANQQQFCCPSSILGLNCILDIGSGPCEQVTQCCDTDQSGGLIDVNLCDIVL